MIKFQSTLPVRGGTDNVSDMAPPFIISIHPPREGRDVMAAAATPATSISIHPPREGRDDNGASFNINQFHFNPPSP